MEAFICEATVDPTGALSVIHVLGELNTGYLAHPDSIRSVEAGLASSSMSAHRFMSNFLSTFYARAVEMLSGKTAEAVLEDVARYLSPFSGRDSTPVNPVQEEFYKERFPSQNSTLGALKDAPFAALLALLRINLDKLLAIGKVLGEYSDTFNAVKEGDQQSV